MEFGFCRKSTTSLAVEADLMRLPISDKALIFLCILTFLGVLVSLDKFYFQAWLRESGDLFVVRWRTRGLTAELNPIKLGMQIDLR